MPNWDWQGLNTVKGSSTTIVATLRWRAAPLIFLPETDGSNGLHAHLPVNVVFDFDIDVTGSLGVNKA